MPGSLQKIYRDGAWWAERPDGSWMRWNERVNTWEPAAAAPFAPTPPAPPVPVSTSGPRLGAPVTAAAVPAPGAYATVPSSPPPEADGGGYAREIFVDPSENTPVWVDAVRMYGFFLALALGVFAIIAFFFRGDPAFLLSSPSPREVLSGTYQPPPSPYLYVALALGVFGLGVLWVKRTGDEEWWPVQLAVLGLAFAGLHAVATNLAGFHEGFDLMRFFYTWTAFLGIGWLYMQFSRWIEP